jgi:hypothetical protein
MNPRSSSISCIETFPQGGQGLPGVGVLGDFGGEVGRSLPCSRALIDGVSNVASTASASTMAVISGATRSVARGGVG